MWQQCLTFVLFNVFTVAVAKIDSNSNSEKVITTKTLAIWRNATVPFYVNPAHFDHEQTTEILTALSTFAFRTCIKFKPVMARPLPNDEVMVFINPDGTKRCLFDTKGHSVFNPHFVKLGYECLKSPHIDMMIMRALGFPFEHNRDTRDLYIEVLHENIEPGFVELFTKEDVLPLELRFLPYDVNSVMHFANRDYSKNGHRTFIFKDNTVQQNRVGLTETDVKKIEVIYGPECRARDRQEKLELCQSYPGVARRKRQTDDNNLGENESTLELVERVKRNVDETVATKSLRVNPNITPPPLNQPQDITTTLKELGIDEAVESIVDQVYKVSSLALKNAREKYCNNTNDKPADVKVAREGDMKFRNSSDVLGIVEVVADFAKGMVDSAIRNLTKFCENSEGLDVYQRFSCSMGGKDPRCRETYRSTKFGAVRHSTQHRPFIHQSTSHKGGDKLKRMYVRGGNKTDDTAGTTTQSIRRKRDLKMATAKSDDKELESTNLYDNRTVDTQKTATDKELDLEKKHVKDSNEKVSESVTEKGDITKIATDEPTGQKIEKGASSIKNVKAKPIEDNVKTGKDDKSKLTETETEDIKAKFEEKIKVNNKDYLRVKSKLPDGSKLGKERRSHGVDRMPEVTRSSQRFIASDRLDKMLAKKMVEKKHKIQKNIRKRKLRPREPGLLNQGPHLFQKQIRNKYENHMMIPERVDGKVDENNDDESGSEEKAVEKLEISKDDDDENEEQLKNLNTHNKRPRTKNVRVTYSDVDENSMTETETEEDKAKPKILPKYKKNSSNRNVPTYSLPKTVTLSKKNKDFYNERLWPSGEVVYVIQDDTGYDLSDMRSRLAEVRDILEEKTCVKLKEIKLKAVGNYDDLIVVDNSPDYVTGRVGGLQRFGSIELFRGGQHRQHAAMMVMAMLGFYFEVSRHDRDKYIRVHMRHVRPDKLHHFEKIRSDATLPLPYDYASATHPAWQFWRQLGRTGISTVATFKDKDPDGSIMKSLGQNEQLLSDIDIVKINSVYGIDCFKNPRAKADHLGKNETLSSNAVEE